VSALSRRARDEAGFTLVELLAGMAIAMIIILAAFELLDLSVKVSAKTQARVEANAQGRQAMDTMTRQLRSQVCLGDVNPIISAGWTGDRQALTFYTDLSDGSGSTPIQRRTLAYDVSDATIVETTWDGTGAAPNTTYNTTPRTRTLLTDVGPDPDGTADATGQIPVFRFNRSDNATPPAFVPLATPLSAADLPRVTKIEIALAVRRTDAPATDEPLVVMRDDVYVRSADPNQTTPTPTCST
jgi:Tfp pilus assembly protein PilW